MSKAKTQMIKLRDIVVPPNRMRQLRPEKVDEFANRSRREARRNRRKTGQIGRRGALSVAVHPDGASQDGLPAIHRFTGMHARDCVPTAG
jgi:hypothetical protein